MRRREFIILTGGALAWAPGARAQTPTAPVIGFLNSSSPQSFGQLVTAFREGLREAGYVDGRNVKIDFRWAEGDENRLKAMAADLVNRRVAIIAATGGIRTAWAAQEATTTIPILFISGANPVGIGLVASINRPGGNATGVSTDTTEMVPKRMEMLQQLVPPGGKVAMLVSPGTVTRSRGVVLPDSELGFAEKNDMLVLNVRNAPEFDKELADEFDAAVKNGARALLVSADPFYYDRRGLITALAARHSLPAVYSGRDYVLAGGLMSYGPSILEAYRQIGIYAGRILNGAKPQDLPVVFPQKWELVINLKTARALGLAISPWFITRADETID
jgi:putative ABC transport system substrate-binding protein